MGERIETGELTPDGLIRTLIALPELAMRVTWIGEQLVRHKTQEMASVLDQVAARSQLTERNAREAMLAIAVFLSRHRDGAWTWALREEARQRHLINLERLLRSTPDDCPPSHTEPRVPDYGTGRALSVGERRSLARRPTRTQLEKLLRDPHPLVLSQLLACPSLKEEDVVAIVTRRPAHIPSLDLVVQSARWIAQRRVRLSLILNPGTPHHMALPFVITCPREDLHLILKTTTIHVVLRTVALELYQRLPPLKASEALALH